MGWLDQLLFIFSVSKCLCPCSGQPLCVWHYDHWERDQPLLVFLLVSVLPLLWPASVSLDIMITQMVRSATVSFFLLVSVLPLLRPASVCLTLWPLRTRWWDQPLLVFSVSKCLCHCCGQPLCVRHYDHSEWDGEISHHYFSVSKCLCHCFGQPLCVLTSWSLSMG